MPLQVHFLNVGHGDCTVIAHPSGRITMIDINNSQDYDSESLNELVAEKAAANPIPSGFGLGGGIGGLGSILQPATTPFASPWTLGNYTAAVNAARNEITDPVEFMKTRYPGRSLWRFVLTHPDMDHMRGIKRLHTEIGFDNFWDTRHSKSITSFKNDSDKEDWTYYQALRSSYSGTRYFTRGNAAYAFACEENGMPGGDRIEILSPTPDLVTACNVAKRSNDISLVLRVAHAGKTVLLPGDAELEAWETMVGYYGDRLKSDFLKASHHGRDSGFDLQALKLIAPTMTFVSVGRKPSTDAHAKYDRQTAGQVASTRFYGDICLGIGDDSNWTWAVSRNYGK